MPVTVIYAGASLEDLLGTGSFYAGLLGTLPTGRDINGVPTGAVEVTSVSYPRQAFTFSNPADATISNVEEIRFDAPEASLGTVRGWAIFSTLAGGMADMLFYGAFTSPGVVGIGSRVNIEPGALIVRLA